MENGPNGRPGPTVLYPVEVEQLIGFVNARARPMVETIVTVSAPKEQIVIPITAQVPSIRFCELDNYCKNNNASTNETKRI